MRKINQSIVSTKEPLTIKSTQHTNKELNPTCTSFMPAFWVVLALHIALGLILLIFPIVSTIHAYLALIVGLFIATTKEASTRSYAVSYIIGSEVLWRMTGANVFWEFSKYAATLILVASILRSKQSIIPRVILAYFLFLLPSVMLTIESLGLSSSRDSLSFNLSGPLLLFVTAWFYSNIRLTEQQVYVSIFIMILPILSSALYALVLTFSTSEIQWVNDSMLASSGGFGPNQVSTAMGLGAIISLFLLTSHLTHTREKRVLSLLFLVFCIQGMLTFSRGGMFTAGLVAAFYLIHLRARRGKNNMTWTLFFLVISLLIGWQGLNAFTDGFIEERFSDINLTNRDTLVRQEMALFLSNPLTGVGPGIGSVIRGTSSHTEFSRLLAEHGVLGIISFSCLLVAGIGSYMRTNRLDYRGIKGSFILWAFLVMTNAAMRMSAISFVFGFGLAHIDDE